MRPLLNAEQQIYEGTIQCEKPRKWKGWWWVVTSYIP